MAQHLRRLNAWVAVAALHALAALATWPLTRDDLDWQPALAALQPWRALSGAWVHWSLSHLLANLAGCAALAWLGWRAGLRGAQVLAWLCAWPLTQLLLLGWPALQHYGGLSGLLHAGVAITAIELLSRHGRERLVGTLLGAGLLAKLTLEAPLGPALRQVDGWDIAIAPAAHLSGVLAGAICALALRAWASRRRTPEA